MNKICKLSGPEEVKKEAMSSPPTVRKTSDTPTPAPYPVSCVPSLRKSSNTLTPAPKRDDDAGIFGQYVACELRKMTDERQISLVKYKIQTIIFENSYGDIHNQC